MSRPTVTTTDERAPLERRTGQDAGVDAEDLADLLAGVLAAEGVPARAEAALTLVGADRIAALNAEHLGGSGPTDVLSFPIDGAGPVPDDEPWMVGDVVLCPEVAEAQAAEHTGTTEDELALLVVHGGLHLCGWDHADPEDRAAMWARERDLLATFGRLPARDPWREGTPS